MTIEDRLRSVGVKAGYETASDASRAHGWNDNTYRAHENGNRGVPRKWLITYSRAFKCSIAWLTTGTEEKAADPAQRSIPIVAWESLPKRGNVMGTTALERASNRTNMLTFGQPVSAESVALPVLDDSMTDTSGSRMSLHVGDHVVISVTDKVKPGQVALIYSPDAGAHCLRKAEFRDHKTVRFVAINPAFPPTDLPANSPHILGVLVAVQRNFT